MVLFDYDSTQRTADQVITYFGRTCFLKRQGNLRPCTAVEISYLPREMDGQVIWHGDRRYYVSPLNVDPPPSSEEDYFVADGVEYRIVVVSPMKPTNVVQYYELQLRR